MKKDDFRGEETFKLPKGYECSGFAAGIKPSGKKDLALLYSEYPANVAGTFTSNLCAAAPVRLCRQNLGSGVPGRAIVVNSGVANAATGERGWQDACAIAEEVSCQLAVDPAEIYVCSTGSIGKYLPMERIVDGIGSLVRNKGNEGDAASEAILTTDKHPKRWTVERKIDGRTVTVSGIAKGAGMIEQDMATMLAFILTDADCDRGALQKLLSDSVANTFNRITVDGDTSTNDSVLLMANGLAGNERLSTGHSEWDCFADAVYEVSSRLAWMIVADGEGATKVVTVQVSGAKSSKDAERAVRAIANSLLVKTAWAGDKPGYGRIIDALGYSGAEIDPEKIDIHFDGLSAISNGLRSGVEEDKLRQCVSRGNFQVNIDLHLGARSASVYTCNITEDYVRINYV